MPTFVPFYILRRNIMWKVFNFKNSLAEPQTVFKAYLSNTAPDAGANEVKGDIAEIAAGNGYTAGGVTLVNDWGPSGALPSAAYYWAVNDVSWTAVGGSIATHQYLIVYASGTFAEAGVDPLIGYIDRGSSDVIAVGNTRVWSFAASGAFEIA